MLLILFEAFVTAATSPGTECVWQPGRRLQHGGGGSPQALSQAGRHCRGIKGIRLEACLQDGRLEACPQDRRTVEVLGVYVLTHVHRLDVTVGIRVIRPEARPQNRRQCRGINGLCRLLGVQSWYFLVILTSKYY